MSERVEFDFGADVSGFVEGTRTMASAMSSTAAEAEGLGGAVRRAAGCFSSLGDAIKTGLGIGVGLAAVQQLQGAISRLGDALISPAAEAETLAVSFRVLLGSASAARDYVKELQTYAAETPFALDDISAASRALLSYGVSAKQSLTILKQLGDVAAVSGGSLADLATVYGKAASVGLDTEAVNQFADRGLNLRALLAARDGLSIQEVQKRIEKKSYGAADINYALAAATGEGGLFHGGTDQLSKTFEGSLSTLKDNLKQSAVVFGESLLEVVTPLVQQATQAVQAIEPVCRALGEAVANIMSFIAEHGKEARAVIEALAIAFVAARSAALMTGVAAAWSGIVGVIKSAITAMTAFGVSLGTATTAAGMLRVVLSSIGKIGWIAIFTAAVEGILWVTRAALEDIEEESRKEYEAYKIAAAESSRPWVEIEESKDNWRRRIDDLRKELEETTSTEGVSSWIEKADAAIVSLEHDIERFGMASAETSLRPLCDELRQLATEEMSLRQAAVAVNEVYEERERQLAAEGKKRAAYYATIKKEQEDTERERYKAYSLSEKRGYVERKADEMGVDVSGGLTEGFSAARAQAGEAGLDWEQYTLWLQRARDIEKAEAEQEAESQASMASTDAPASVKEPHRDWNDQWSRPGWIRSSGAELGNGGFVMRVGNEQLQLLKEQVAWQRQIADAATDIRDNLSSRPLGGGVTVTQ